MWLDTNDYVRKCSECNGLILPGEIHFRDYGDSMGFKSICRKCAEDKIHEWLDELRKYLKVIKINNITKDGRVLFADTKFGKIAFVTWKDEKSTHINDIPLFRVYRQWLNVPVEEMVPLNEPARELLARLQILGVKKVKLGSIMKRKGGEVC